MTLWDKIRARKSRYKSLTPEMKQKAISSRGWAEYLVVGKSIIYYARLRKLDPHSGILGQD